ncbi:MAG: hopanoid biosynthesis-associated protein HpnK [Candidatus Brocadiales bacterium]|nr:hopanoid biosynthesis-associated protein HpnK [Candidatus Bathyanammoxibius sp.]
MKVLIVTADDFGVSSNINEAIIKAHAEGILTSASLAVGGPAFEHAVELAKANPELSVGLHIVLAQGKSVLPHKKIPGLVDQDDNFRNNPALAGLRYFFRPSAISEIRDEVGAQIDKFLSTGLRLDFINGHHNIHVHPRVFDIILELTGGLETKNFRLPRDVLFRTLKYDGSRIASKLFHHTTFSMLSRRCIGPLKRNGFLFTDRVYGLLQSGDMNAGFVSSLITDMPEGVSEMYFHPCITPCAEYSRWMPGYHPEEELGVLTDRGKKIGELLRSNSIRLADYTVLRETNPA